MYRERVTSQSTKVFTAINVNTGVHQSRERHISITEGDMKGKKLLYSVAFCILAIASVTYIVVFYISYLNDKYKEEQEDEISIQIFKYAILNSAYSGDTPPVFFLELANKEDPSERLIKKLLSEFGEHPPELYKKTRSVISDEGKFSDRSTGRAGPLFLIKKIQWINKSIVYVTFIRYRDTHSSAAFLFELALEDGRWNIKAKKMLAVS